ncbi:MAG: sodium:solute symporter [Cyclobacteriaceae bacterium]|nr:sodium:solute symporter [Cyclobacteriaceae bacterium]
MSLLDWLVLFGTILTIVSYGVLKTRGKKTMESYLKGDGTLKWWMIGISIMATQASAITFLSTPGQAIEDGMRFLQFYFGLPIAMVIISVTFVPIYYNLNVLTAYEYLESRFDLKTRLLTASLFLVLRGLSAGITIFAPSLVLSTILGWSITTTTLLIGAMVIVYSVSGGSRAVSLTQRMQLSVVMGGMLLAGILAFTLLPEKISFSDTLNLAGELGKFNLVDLEFNPNERYNIWSGLIAGTFLFLSYFGTDQSQVGRYLGGRSIAESRLGLIFNGLLKIPMQFIILFIGVLVFVFYLFNQPPVFYNQVLRAKVLETEYGDKLKASESEYDLLYAEKREAVDQLVESIQREDDHSIMTLRERVLALNAKEKELREGVKETIKEAIPAAKTQDRDYIFLNFVLNNLPHGIIGLLLAVMFLAAMSSMAGELSALSSTTASDLYRRAINKTASPEHYLKASRGFTVLWAVLAMVFAMLASFAENLIQFVNIVGSLFYGTILGIFLTAFYVQYVKGNAVFIAAIIAEAVVLYCYFFTDLAFLLYNIVGCAIVVLGGILLQPLLRGSSK